MLASIAKLTAPLRKGLLPARTRKVLVVDDDPLCLRVVVQRLRRQGYDAVGARDGEEALELFQNHGADVVLTDICMPGMDGVNLIINLTLDRPDLPVIGMTGLSRTARQTQAARRFGASRVLSKPLSAVRIQEALQEVVAA